MSGTLLSLGPILILNDDLVCVTLTKGVHKAVSSTESMYQLYQCILFAGRLEDGQVSGQCAGPCGSCLSLWSRCGQVLLPEGDRLWPGNCLQATIWLVRKEVQEPMLFGTYTGSLQAEPEAA